LELSLTVGTRFETLKFSILMGIRGPAHFDFID